jgi:16S rRNA (guanine(966)-N(2))-methyltransferase RsmD
MLENSPRITSGVFRSRKLRLPKHPNLKYVKDMVRQAVFMIIGDKIKDAKVLDLFSGSGILGFESLSRGASFVDFVDENYSSIETTKINAHDLKIEGQIDTHQTKAITYCGNTDKNFDIVFLDPYYEDRHHKFLLQLISENLNKQAVVVFLHGGTNIQELIQSLNYEIFDERKYGSTFVTFLRIKEPKSV